MGAAALMATDRRTTGMYIEDESIEWKVNARMRGGIRAFARHFQSARFEAPR